MGDEIPPIRDTENDTEPPSTDAATESVTQPWITRISIIMCIGICLCLTGQDDYASWESLSIFGYLPASDIWGGAYWALITSAFVHLALWHVALNVYWLWVLGSRLERAIGAWPFLGFVVASAFVSSSFQLAVSDDTGVGASGVVYAIFGFMWRTRHRYSQFNDVLDTRTNTFFLAWLAWCVVLTYADVWSVGNAAHVSGLLFGVTAARCFVPHRKQRLRGAGLVALVSLSIVPLLWCPWSVTWLSQKAYEAHVAEQYEAAIDNYAQIIQLDPANAWAYEGRSLAYEALGESAKADADLQMAHRMDPSIDEPKTSDTHKRQRKRRRNKGVGSRF